MPPLKSELKKCGGKKCPLKSEEKSHGGGKCHQNGKVMAESATTFQIWWNRSHHTHNCGGTLTTTHHIQGAGAPAKTEKGVNAYGVYIFSGKGPTFSASCKTYEHYFKKGLKSNGTDKKRLV